mgnify:CR=1 FL=1
MGDAEPRTWQSSSSVHRHMPQVAAEAKATAAAEEAARVAAKAKATAAAEAAARSRQQHSGRYPREPSPQAGLQEGPSEEAKPTEPKE